MRIECVSGVWWFVDGDGARFVSLGVNHLQPNCWLAPYNREASLARYGSDLAAGDDRFDMEGHGVRRLMQSLVPRLKQWGFNTLGMHTHDIPVETYSGELYSVECVDAYHLGSRFRFGIDRFPDVFSKEFERRVDEAAGACCWRNRSNRRLIGYAFSDIPRWYFYPGQSDMLSLPVHPWAEDLRCMPRGSAGRAKWLEIMRQRHPDAVSAPWIGAATTEANAAWDVPRWPSPSDPVRDRGDSEALLAAAAERWYSVHAEAIRRHDPGALILGDKLHSPHTLPAWLLPIVAKHVDVLFIQWYQPFEAQRGTLERLHRLSGLPILNGDSGFCWPEPPRRTRVKGVQVGSREAVGAAYHDYLRGIMSLPFMLGWHFCGLMEQWDGARRGYPEEPNENGFMDPFESVHEALVARVSEANAMAVRWHEGSRPTIKPGM
jgi:hypothetical protein